MERNLEAAHEKLENERKKAECTAKRQVKASKASAASAHCAQTPGSTITTPVTMPQERAAPLNLWREAEKTVSNVVIRFDSIEREITHVDSNQWTP